MAEFQIGVCVSGHSQKPFDKGWPKGDMDHTTEIYDSKNASLSKNSSMSYQLFSGLLAGSIPQSGSPLSPWSIYRLPFDMRSRTNQLSVMFGCPTAPSEAMLECMRIRPAQDLSHAQSSISVSVFFCTRLNKSRAVLSALVKI